MARSTTHDVNALLAAVAALPTCDAFVRATIATYLAGKLVAEGMQDVLYATHVSSHRNSHEEPLTKWTRRSESAALSAIWHLLGGMDLRASVTHMREYLGKIERRTTRATSSHSEVRR